MIERAPTLLVPKPLAVEFVAPPVGLIMHASFLARTWGSPLFPESYDLKATESKRPVR
jgi:hypothetical protein